MVNTPYRTNPPSSGGTVTRFDKNLRLGEHNNAHTLFEDAALTLTKWNRIYSITFVRTFSEHAPSHEGRLSVSRAIVGSREPIEAEYLKEVHSATGTNPVRGGQHRCGSYTITLITVAFGVPVFAFHHALLCCEEEVLHWRLHPRSMRGFPTSRKPNIKRWWIHLEDANYPVETPPTSPWLN